MRHAATIALFLTASALSACVASRSGTTEMSTATSAKQALLDALSVFGGERLRGDVSGPAAALAGLEEHENAGDPSEREMIATLLPIVSRVADGETALGPADYRTVKDVMNKMASKHPNDFEIQYAMVTGMAAMETALKNAGVEDDSARETRAKALTAKFNNQARAHAHLGHVQAESGDDEGALVSYARCLKLDPGIASCKSDLKLTAGRFLRPRCTSVAAKRFGLHPAYTPNATTAKNGRKGLKPIAVDKRQLLMEIKPVLDGKAIEEADAVGEGKDAGVDITLSPIATAKLADVTANLAERQGYLAVVVDGKVKAAPQVMSQIESSTFRVAGVQLDKLCTKLERRPLPPGVAPYL